MLEATELELLLANEELELLFASDELETLLDTLVAELKLLLEELNAAADESGVGAGVFESLPPQACNKTMTATSKKLLIDVLFTDIKEP